ncbi:MAG: DUF3568 family protein [Desulfobaccales bacterium]|jgi:hypothetical protein
MRLKIWRTKLGILLAALLVTASCVETLLLGVGGMAAIGSYKWVEGTMEKDYPRPMQEVWTATLEACRDLQLRITVQEYNPVDSHIEAVAPPDTNVKIQLVSRPNQITTVKVRFGLMGNGDASAYFHRRLMVHLGMPPA